MGRPFWEQAGVASKIDVRIGPAIESLDAILADESTHGTFDFGYVDADKENYPGYCDRILTLLKPNGFLIVDNTIWKGKVADPQWRENDENTKLIVKCVQDLIANDALEVCTLMLADGVTIARKK